jgi:hypothetical protein
MKQFIKGLAIGLSAIIFIASSVYAATQIFPSQIKPGTNTQVMTTVGGVTTWAAPSGGDLFSGLISDTATTTDIAKGDIIVRNASSKWTNLAVGTDGYVLTASSSAPFGLSFEPSSGGTGVISINGVSTSTFTLATGTTGTDFTIATSTDTVTFNLPTASAANRGLLSTTSFSLFNGKQDALSSGVNIKTVGGVSLLGAGDIGVIGTNYGGTGTTTALGTMAFQNSNAVTITGGNAILTTATATNIVLTGASSTFLAADANGKIIATSTPSGGSTKFGGTGTDGALSITSGTTTIDLASSSEVVKNYTSISITGGTLNFSNPAATSGTIIFLKSQGDCTITSTTSPAIDASGLGAEAGKKGWGYYFYTNAGSGESGGSGIHSGYVPFSIKNKALPLFTGAGGANGDNGAGAKGGGAVMIECGGSLNFTSTTTVAGINGNTGSGASYGGGGGGAGGSFILLYNGSLVANSGTIIIKGGDGGNSTGGSGGAGGNGSSGSGNGGAGGHAGYSYNGGGGGASAFKASDGSSGGATGNGGGGGGGASGQSLIGANTEF